MSLFLGGRESRSAPRWGFEPPVPPFPGADSMSGSGAVALANRAEGALVVPTVWACVGLIANAVSMLPLAAYEETFDGVLNRQPNPELIVTPCGDMTSSEWMHMLVVSLLLRGNGIGRVIARDQRQVPTQIMLLNPDKVRISVNADGTLSYTLMVDGRQEPIPPADIWHVRGMTLPGSRVGMSPIAYAAAMLDVDIAARKFSGDFFAGGGIPKAIVKSAGDVTQQQARTIKDRLLAASRNREPTVLGNGVDYHQISVAPEESQFLLTHQMTVTEVARFFHVPAGMVGGSEGGSMTYANVEQRSLDFLVHCVQPWLQRIEQALSALLPSNIQVKFDESKLLRTDAETRARVNVQLLAGKIVTPTEVRASYDLPPMTPDQKAEADMVPLTVTPTGGPKALPALKDVPGPAAPAPADEGVPANA